jgi:ribosomal protein S26
MSENWELIESSWHEEKYVHCDVCGRLIPRRKWVFTDDGVELIACEPECQKLYEDYVKPVHGGVSR